MPIDPPNYQSEEYSRHLENNLKFALGNPALRQAILGYIQTYVINNLGIEDQIISDEQLIKIYLFVLFLIEIKPENKEAMHFLRRHINVMPDESSLGAGNALIFTRKDAKTKYPNAPELPRTIIISKSIFDNEGHIRIGAIPNSKNALGNKIPGLKQRGGSAVVSRVYDITPINTRALPLATKSYNLGMSIQQAAMEQNKFNKMVAIAQALGARIFSTTKYQHIAPEVYEAIQKLKADKYARDQKTLTKLRELQVKKDFTAITICQNAKVQDDIRHRENIKKLEASVEIRIRTIEGWFEYNLYSIHEQIKLLLNDQTFINPELYIQKFVYQIISQILKQLYDLHYVALVAHGDLKPQNILLTSYCDQWYAKLNDFDLSEYIANLGTKLPVTTFPYASPDIVEFNLNAHERLRNPDLYRNFTAKNPDGSYKYPSYGREIVEVQQLLGSRVQDAYTTAHFDNLRYTLADDMFSLGVMLFEFITGNYPTITGLKGKAYGNFEYLDVKQAYREYPQYAPLLRGLLDADPNKRFTVDQAIRAFNRIPNPAKIQQESFEDSYDEKEALRKTNTSYSSTSTNASGRSTPAPF